MREGRTAFRVRHSSESRGQCERTSARASRVAAAMRAAGVLIKDASRMHPALAECLRLTVGAPEENEAMLQALTAALQAVPAVASAAQAGEAEKMGEAGEAAEAGEPDRAPQAGAPANARPANASPVDTSPANAKRTSS